MAEDWRAREADVDAIAAARQPDPFAVLGPHLTPGGMGHSSLRARRDSRPCAFTRGRASGGAAAPQGRFLRGLIARRQGAPGLSARGRDRAAGRRHTSTATPSARRWARSTTTSCVEGTHRQLYRRLGAQLTRARRRRRACCSRVGRPMRRASRSSATSIAGTDGGARCASASTAACGRSSSPASVGRQRSTNMRSPAPTARFCR